MNPFIWHIIARVGSSDDYDPGLEASVPRIELDLRRPVDDAGISIGPDPISEFIRATGLIPPTPACDLLNLAMAVYTADLRIPRTYASDRWCREIVVHLPVTNISAWASVQNKLEQLLNFLSGDCWSLIFREAGSITVPTRPKKSKAQSKPTCVCLFSGGLDSLVGAIDLLSGGETVALVGQYGAGSTNGIQEEVLAPLRNKFGTSVLDFRYFIQPNKDREVGEPTQRSRSIVFMALGVMVASAFKVRLIIAENGLISLNVPLTYARLGSPSTRTTHPHVVAELSKVLRKLGIKVQIDLPYRFATKGEMLSNSRDYALLQEAAPKSVSCSHPDTGRYRGHSPGAHCGYCVPCIIRRASLFAAKLPEDDYWDDPFVVQAPSDSESRSDVLAFEMAIERLQTASKRHFIAAVCATGCLLPKDAAKFAETYRRGMLEVAALFDAKARP